MRAFSSLFSQLLTIFSRVDFAAAVRRHKAERAAKGFDCWTQFVAMLFCQLGRAHSLREICGGLASVEGKLSHLGVGPLRRARRSPMPTRAVRQPSSRTSSIPCWAAASRLPPRGSFALRTSPSAGSGP